MLQCGWTLKLLCQTEESSYRRSHILWFFSYEMSRIGNSIETGSELVSRISFLRQGERWNEKQLLRYGDSFGVMKILRSWIVVMVAQFWKYYLTTDLYTLLVWTLRYVNCNIIKLLLKTKKKPTKTPPSLKKIPELLSDLHSYICLFYLIYCYCSTGSFCFSCTSLLANLQICQALPS